MSLSVNIHMCILAFLYQFVVNVKHFLCHIVSFKPLDVLLAFGYSLFSSGCTHKYLFDSFRHAEGVIGLYIYRFVSSRQLPVQATTGSPLCIASMIGSPNPSYLEGYTQASAIW